MFEESTIYSCEVGHQIDKLKTHSDLKKEILSCHNWFVFEEVGVKDDTQEEGGERREKLRDTGVAKRWKNLHLLLAGDRGRGGR